MKKKKNTHKKILQKKNVPPPPKKKKKYIYMHITSIKFGPSQRFWKRPLVDIESVKDMPCTQNSQHVY